MEEWGRLLAQPPSPIGYWYRQAPAPLVAESASSKGKAGVGDPPVNRPGMLTVVMDLDGSLRRFAAVPPEHEAPPVELKPPDWIRSSRRPTWTRRSLLPSRRNGRLRL